VNGKPCLDSLYKQIKQASDAYINDGPQYTLDRVVGLIQDLRARCDDVERIITNPQPAGEKEVSE